MRKTMISQKGAKEETDKNKKFDQARHTKKVLNLRKYFFDSFVLLRAPERHPRRWGAAEAGYACS